jgi:hypothetical protein
MKRNETNIFFFFQVERELTNLKLEKSVIDKINQTLTLKDLDALEKVLSSDSEVTIVSRLTLSMKSLHSFGMK